MKLQIQQERIKKGWSQKYVASKIGISKTAVQYLETGQCKPSYDVLVKLEDLFHKSHRRLFAVVPDESNLSLKE